MNSAHFLNLSSLLLCLLFLIQAVSTSTVTVTVATPISTSAEYTDSKKFKAAVLNSTNTYRSQHNATALAWNDTLTSYAEKWGDGCIFKHSGGPSGENLASGYPNATTSIEAWGNEREDYDFKAAKFSEKTGHFTQLVWKSTTTVGCSRTNCTDKGDGSAPGWYVVCEYYPPGNVIGQFKDNVQSQVKGQGGDKCPQGADCSAASSVRPHLLSRGWAWVAIGAVVGCFF